jgi:hypothetical protein
MSQRRRRSSRGGNHYPGTVVAVDTLASGAGTSGAARRERMVAIVAVVTLATGAGIASWRMLDEHSDSAWVAKANSQLGSVNQQLALLAQTGREWQAQPAALTTHRPDVSAYLLQRETELAQERAQLAGELARYEQLPVLQARAAAAQAHAQDLQHQLDTQPAPQGNPVLAQQLTAQLRAAQLQQQQAAAEIAAVRAAEQANLPDDADKTASVVGIVTSVMGHPPAPGSVLAAPPPPGGALPPRIDTVPAPAAPLPATLSRQPTNAPSEIRIEAAPPGAPLTPASPPAPADAPRLVPHSQASPQLGHGSASGAGHDVPRSTGPARGGADPSHGAAPSAGHPDQDGQSPVRPTVLAASPVQSAPAAPLAPALSPAPEGARLPAREQPAAEPLPGQQQQPAPAAETPQIEQQVPQSSQQAPQQAPEQAQPDSSGPVMSAEQVKRSTGSNWVARQSQTPEGRAIMRQLFGGGDAENGDSGKGSARANDEAGVRRPSRTTTSADTAPDDNRGSSHNRRSDTDSATRSGSAADHTRDESATSSDTSDGRASSDSDCGSRGDSERSSDSAGSENDSSSGGSGRDSEDSDSSDSSGGDSSSGSDSSSDSRGDSGHDSDSDSSHGDNSDN